MSTSTWGGREFEVYKPDTEWYDVGGVYIFTAQQPAGLLGDIGATQWRALYVGETESFKNRPLANHEKWPAAVGLGATHVHTRNEGMITRKALEVFLIQKYDPPLNRK